MRLIFRCFHSLDDVGDAERIQTASGHRCRVRMIALFLVLFFSFRVWIVDRMMDEMFEARVEDCMYVL